MNRKVDEFLTREKKWGKEFEKLRKIILSCGLQEEFKWGNPCYTFDNNNIVLIHGFKEYCALLFFKGALLRDIEGILVQQTKNVQATRQARFTGLNEIKSLEKTLRNYIFEAVEVEKAGVKIKFKKTSEYEFPEELRKFMNENPSFKSGFDALTPGRQRGWLLHFSSAQQSKTRTARIEKSVSKILKGKGFNER